MQLGNLSFIKNSKLRNSEFFFFFEKKKNSELLFQQRHHYLFDLKISILGISKGFFVSFGYFEYKESLAQSWVKNTK